MSQSITPADYWPLDVGNRWQWKMGVQTLTLECVAEEILLDRSAIRLKGFSQQGDLSGGLVMSTRNGSLELLADDWFGDSMRIEYRPTVAMLPSIPRVSGPAVSAVTVHDLFFWNPPDLAPVGAKATYQIQVTRLAPASIFLDGRPVQFNDCIRLIFKRDFTAPGEEKYSETGGFDLAAGVGVIRLGVGENDTDGNIVGPLTWHDISAAVVRGKPVGSSGIPPSFVSQPQPVTVTVGQSAVFTVVASGTEPFNYQWLFDGIPLAGANTSSFSIPAATVGDAGSYSVRVTNLAGSVQSAAANLTVTQPVATRLDVKRNANGSLVLTWNGSGKLVYAQSIAGPFLEVPSAKSGYTAFPSGISGFYAIVP